MKPRARCGAPSGGDGGYTARQLAAARDPWRAVSSPIPKGGQKIFHVRGKKEKKILH